MLIISVDTTLPPEEHSTLVPFKLEFTLSITTLDTRGPGEVEVLKNSNVVCPVMSGVTLAVLPPEEMNRSSGVERPGIVRLHCSRVSFDVAWQVRFS
jgi:hypothetical protein